MRQPEYEREKEPSVFYHTSKSVLLPLLADFVQWVIRSACKEGVGRLYFLARDGYPMYLTAKLLLGEKIPQIQCRYLFCSRLSLRLPAFHLQGEACLNQICAGGIDVTLRKVLKRAALTEKEILETARRLGLSDRLEDLLSYQEVRGLIPKLSRLPGFLEMVYAHSKAAYSETMGYLKQEGFFDGTAVALVDSGWIGTMQETINRLLKSGGCEKRVSGYYFGLYSLPKGCDFSEYHAYYFSPKGHIKRKAFFSNSLFEGIFSAPHGMTLGYRKKGKSYVPVLKEEESLNQELLLAFRDMLVPFMLQEGTRLPSRIEEWKAPAGRRRQRLFARLARFMSHPTREEAEVFGSLKFTDDVLEEENQLVAARLGEKEIAGNHVLAKSLAMLGLRKKTVRESAWMEGSIVLAGRNIRRHLRGNRRYKYLLYLKKWLLESR